MNEQLWIGHFDLWTQDGMVMFRHALVLAGGVEATGQQCEALLGSALEACERYFPAFQFVVWAGKAGARGARRRDVRDLGRGVSSACHGGLAGCPVRSGVPMPAVHRRRWPGMMPDLPLSLRNDDSRVQTSAKILRPLVLVGAGKMGGAMLDGWLARELRRKKIIVLEPQPGKDNKGAAPGAG